MKPEKIFEIKVKDHLMSLDAWFIKYWAGAEYTKAGIPDIIACVYGNFFGIEVKAEKGSPSVLQLVNLRKIREAGGYGILLYPKDFEDFKEFVKDPPSKNEWYINNITEQYEWYNKLNS